MSQRCRSRGTAAIFIPIVSVKRSPGNAPKVKNHWPAEIESLPMKKSFSKTTKSLMKILPMTPLTRKRRMISMKSPTVWKATTLTTFTDVSDEILEQIPVSAASGATGGIYRPHISNLSELPPCRISEFSQPFTAATHNGTARNGQVGTLISGMTTTLINREALKHLPLPEETDTFKPISHFRTGRTNPAIAVF